MPAREGPEGASIRPVHTDDVDRLSHLLHGLSARSRRARFHGAVREVPRGVLEQMTRVDGSRELALVAGRFDDGAEQLVAEARYVQADGDAAAREFALVVTDALQRRGLGEQLLRALVAHAERHGVVRLFGDVQRDNAPMLALAARLGFQTVAHPEGGTLLRVERLLTHPPSRLQ